MHPQPPWRKGYKEIHMAYDAPRYRKRAMDMDAALDRHRLTQRMQLSCISSGAQSVVAALRG